jgi:hypothetical protein
VASTRAEPSFKTLSPSSTWNVNYAEDSCQLLRSFGPENERITLRLEQFAPSEHFYLTIAGHPLKSTGTLRTTLKLGFPPGPISEITALSGTFGEQNNQFVMAGSWTFRGSAGKANPAVSILTEARKVTSFVIDQKHDDADYIVATGPMDKPMAALRTCTDELVRHWGLDVEAQRTLTSPASPLTSQVTWLKASDYPIEAWQSGASAVVNFRLMVDATGTPTDCALQASTAGEAFRELTCRLLLKRARFTPARDSAGKPIASYFISAVQWLAG